MGNDLWYNHSDMQLEDYHPSCMWDMSHIFDYHHWPNVKKLLPHKRYLGSKHARYNVIAKSSSKDNEFEEVIKFLGEEYDCTVEKATSKTISTNKKSRMAHIKALIAKVMSNEDHHKDRHQAFHFPLGPKLQRTLSLHHLEPLDDWLDKNQIVLLQNISDASLAESLDTPLPCTPENLNSSYKPSEALDNQDIRKEVLNHQFEEYVDVLEVFKVNKKLFQEIIRDPVIGKLDRIYSLQNQKKNSRLTKLNSFPMVDDSSRSHKFRHGNAESVIWSCPKVEKLFKGTRAPRLVASKSFSNADTKRDGVIKLKRSSSSPSSTNGIDNQSRFRRVSSLNNSMDKYTQLIEHSFNKDTKLHHRGSLKLTNEDGFLSSGHDLNLESHSTIQNEENGDLSYGMNEAELVNFAVLEKCHKNDVLEEIDSCSRIGCTSEFTTEINGEGIDVFEENSASIVELITNDNNCNSEDDACFTRTDSSQIAQESSNFKDGVICSAAQSQISAGLELKSGCIGSLDEMNENSKSQKIDNASEYFDNYFLPLEHDSLDEKIIAKFNYIKDVFMKSHLGKNNLKSSNLLDQPMRSSLFEERCGYEVVDSWDHQLLFDLVNEILLNVNEKSYAYWPRALSNTCCVHPLLTDHYFLQEVWKIISKYLGSKAEQELSLDHAMTQDLATADGWTNLQYDSESVGLEIEDIMLDELLDEILYS